MGQDGLAICTAYDFQGFALAIEVAVCFVLFLFLLKDESRCDDGCWHCERVRFGFRSNVGLFFARSTRADQQPAHSCC